jgi:four helix bundle protein
MVDRFEDLEAWKTARQLVNLIYDLSSRSPFSRDFGFVDQARRAAVSVMNNIAEGFESRTQGLFAEYLGRAKGSAGEVRSVLYVALDRHYVSKEEFDIAYDLADKSSRQVARLTVYLECTPINRTRRVKAAHDV